MKQFVFMLFLILPIFILLHEQQRKKMAVLAVKLKQKNKEERKKKMLKLLENYIGKPCEIDTIDRSYEGKIVRLEDGCIVLCDRWYQTEVLINPEYVVGFREKKVKEKKKEKQFTSPSELEETAEAVK